MWYVKNLLFSEMVLPMTSLRTTVLLCYLGKVRWRRPPESSSCSTGWPGPSSAGKLAEKWGMDTPPGTCCWAHIHAQDTHHFLRGQKYQFGRKKKSIRAVTKWLCMSVYLCVWLWLMDLDCSTSKVLVEAWTLWWCRCPCCSHRLSLSSSMQNLNCVY